jgi:hypothetical protein
MNWRAGMLRVWIVASLIWVSFIFASAYQKTSIQRQINAQHQECLDRTKANPNLNPLDCFFTDKTFDSLTPTYLRYAALAAGPVCAAFGLWFVGIWIVAGFNYGRPK